MKPGWDGTHEDAMRRCGFVTDGGIPGASCNEYCNQRTRIRYPCDEPENGPAREYCPDGHSTCYHCGKWFQAITKTEDWVDEETGLKINGGLHESDWCTACEEEHRKTHCSCGVSIDDVPLHKHTVRDEGGDEYSWLCCGGIMCCEKANE